MFKLLLVDDRKEVVQNIARAVDWAAKGISVECCYNGRDSLEKIKSEQIDMVITDIKMPYMDGLELVENAAQINDHVKFIILTGYDEFSYARQALHLGVVEYLSKPVCIEELEGIVQKHKEKIEKEDKKRQDKEKTYGYIIKNLPVLRDKYFQELTHSEILDEQEVRQKFETLNINLETKNCIVILLEMDRSYKVEREEIELYRYAIGNIASEIIGEKFSCEIFNDERERQVVLANYPENQNRLLTQYEIYSLVKKIQDNVKKFFGISLSAGIGEGYRSVEGIKKSYEDAREALSHKLYYGDGSIISMVDLEGNHGAQDAGYIKECEKRIILLAGEGKKEAAKEEVGRFFQEIQKQRGLSPNTLADKIVHFIIELCMKSSVNNEFPMFQLLEEYRKLTTLDEIQEFVEHYVEKFAEEAASVTDDIKNNILKVKKYIDSRYYETITLKRMSQYIFISQPYLSYMFKEITGYNFNEYLTNVRMEKAKELLLKPGNRVYEVCEQVGYQDKKHFTDLFRKYTGMTPKEWIKNN